MTNTLHRFGDAESFRDDFVVFAIPCRGKNDQDCLPKLRAFLETAVRFGPVNLGDARHGGAIRPCRKLNPLCHWGRDAKPDFQGTIDGLDGPTTVAAVFDNRAAVVEFVKVIQQLDLGLSVNISTSVDGAEQICHELGIPRHSLSYSLGFEGRVEKLPDSRVLMLSTMCGHGMVSHSLAQKMISWVREGRRSPEQAATYLERFCSCGVYNRSRAARILLDRRKAAE